MFWYIMICILMLYPLCVTNVGRLSGKRTQEIALIAGCLILWFFMAMRDVSVGVDTQYYSYVFMQFADIPFSKVFSAVTYATESETWAFDFEPGYRLFNKLISLFSRSPQAITICNSTVIMALVYRLIRKYSSNFLLSLWLYITLGVFQTEMNVTRNAIAILIVYNGFSYVTKQDFFKYLLCCVAASLFHIAALVFIPLYWVFVYFKPNLINGMWLVCVCFLLGVIFPVISPYIRLLLPNRMDKYFMGGNDSLSSLLVGVLNGVIFAVAYWFIGQAKRKTVFSECRIGVMMLIINLCFFGLNIGLDYAARMAALFGPYLMILIPKMLGLIESETKKNNATFLIALLCGCQYVMRMCINNIGGTMPFSFFW